MIDHEGTIGRQRQLEQGAGKGISRLDEREETAGRQVHALQRAANQADDLAHEPVVLVGGQRLVHGRNRRGRAHGPQDDHANLGLVQPQPQQAVVELAEGPHRPGLVSGQLERLGCGRLRRVGRRDRQLADALGAVERRR